MPKSPHVYSIFYGNAWEREVLGPRRECKIGPTTVCGYLFAKTPLYATEYGHHACSRASFSLDVLPSIAILSSSWLSTLPLIAEVFGLARICSIVCRYSPGHDVEGSCGSGNLSLVPPQKE